MKLKLFATKLNLKKNLNSISLINSRLIILVIGCSAHVAISMLKNNLQLLMSPLCAHLDCTQTEPSHIATQLNLQVFFPYTMICTPIISCINIPVVNFMPFVLFVTTYNVYFKKLPVIKKLIFLKLKPKYKIFESHCTYFIIISPTVLSKLVPVSLPPSLPTLWSSSMEGPRSLPLVRPLSKGLPLNP